MKINETSAFVTGGGSGLGEATARHLSALGARVTVFDLDGAKARSVASDIGGSWVAGDVASEKDVEHALANVAETQGSPRIVVNCAGIAAAGRIIGREGPMPLSDFERVIRVNLTGTFNVMRVAAAGMEKLDADEDGERGAIVNTASVAAFEGQIGQAAYSASKGGIVAMSLPAAREFARFGVRVNVIAPGIFITPLLRSLPEDVQTSLAASIPFPSRLGKPAEFAEAAAFCITMGYLNGEVIRLDGATRLAPK